MFKAQSCLAKCAQKSVESRGISTVINYDKVNVLNSTKFVQNN